MGEFEELVLLCVWQLAADAYVSAIQERLAEDGGREVTLGAIYASLDRMQRKGFAESRLEDSSSPGRARRHYTVTPEGRRALQRNKEIRERLWCAIRTGGLAGP